MIHIVSGMYRSGTSAMMAALIAGGMNASYCTGRDAMASANSDDNYKPNPGNKLYEIPLREYANLDFPLKYQGTLVKILLGGLDHLAVNPEGYRVVIMRRDPEEIRQSYEAFFGRKCPALNEYAERIERAAKMLANREDVVSVTAIDYPYLVDSPEPCLIRLRREGWPIDPLEAAATIDPAQYRFRKEQLTVGI